MIIRVRGESFLEIEQKIRLIAGTMTILGVALGYFFSAYFYIIPLIVGLMLAQSSLTGYCPMEYCLKKMK